MKHEPLPGTPVPSARRLNIELVLAAVAGLAATITAAAITAGSVTGEGAALAGLARATMVAVPIAVGLYAWHRRPADRFGRVLVAAGFGWFLTTLSESDDELLYSIGRVAGWVVELGLIWLILAFPSGRLRTRADHLLVYFAAALVAVLYLPTALIADGFPVPSQFTSCDSACPPNAFQIGSEPAFLDAAVVPLREAADHPAVRRRHRARGPAHGRRDTSHAPDPASGARDGGSAAGPLRPGTARAACRSRVARGGRSGLGARARGPGAGRPHSSSACSSAASTSPTRYSG